jgi:putative transposase
MTSHIHMLASPQDQNGITRMMPYVGRYYVPYINYTYGTSGSLWAGRYKASLINEDEYLLTCMRYIELNPVRAEIVCPQGQYRWSSYRCNGQGKADKLVTPHPIYKMLGKTQSACLEAYKALFKAHLEKGELTRYDLPGRQAPHWVTTISSRNSRPS